MRHNNQFLDLDGQNQNSERIKAVLMKIHYIYIFQPLFNFSAFVKIILPFDFTWLYSIETLHIYLIKTFLLHISNFVCGASLYFYDVQHWNRYLQMIAAWSLWRNAETTRTRVVRVIRMQIIQRRSQIQEMWVMMTIKASGTGFGPAPVSKWCDSS